MRSLYLLSCCVCALVGPLACVGPEEVAPLSDEGLKGIDAALDGALPDGDPTPDVYVDDAAAPDMALDLDAAPEPEPADMALNLDAAPEPEPVDMALDLDAAPEPDPGWGPCAVDGVPGRCIDVADCAGVTTAGLCPGPAQIQCCTPGEPDPEPEPEPEPEPVDWGPCAVDGVAGTCLPVEACDGDATPGFCPGPAGIQCCTPADPAPGPEPDPEPDPEPMDWGPCAVRGVAGTCLPVDACPGFTTAGLCPGPADVQCCTDEAPPEPEPLDCDPDARPQPNAGLSEAGGLDGCPDGMLGVDDFCVDRYEAALLEVLPDGSERPWSPYHNPGAAAVRAVSWAAAVPQGYINGLQAADACAASGKRLCTDAEWLRACQWTDGRRYPYGPDRVAGLCNDARAQHPAVELFPDDPNPFDRIQHPCINQLGDGLALTGDHPQCVTPEGLYDMMGNLHEWTADPAGTFRGGFYVDTVRNGPGCLYRTTAHDRGHWDYSTGFRCCADR